MSNKRKRKLFILIIAILSLSIGFAFLSTTLKIDGTTGISKQTWSIYWANPIVNQNSTTDNIPIIEQDQGDKPNTKVTWTTTLNLPGDFYEFEVDAVNAGTIDAMITSTSSSITDENNIPATLPSYINYTVTYVDGISIDNYHLLKKATNNTPTIEKYKIRVEFLDTITIEQLNAIPEEGLTYDFSYMITYGQATDEAHPHHIMTYGDSAYGYKERFIASEWDNSNNFIINNNYIDINPPLFDFSGSTYYSRFSRDVSQDYSFSGRYTYKPTNIETQKPVLMLSLIAVDGTIDDKSISLSFKPSMTNWRDQNGESESGPDGWNTGSSSYTVPISIIINNDQTHDYATANYPTLFNDVNTVHEIWYDYDGIQKKLYIYIADYDTNGDVIKPTQPLMTCPIDLESLFGGTRKIKFGFTTQAGWYGFRLNLYGMEFNSYPSGNS